MSSLIGRIKDFLDPLSTAQRMLFFGLITAIVVFAGTLFYWALSPSYTLLFGSLKQDSAQKIVKKLDKQGIDYKLENGGGSIYVPSDKVDELRLDMAPLGAPKSDMKGYELFDNKSLGMTDYMQQLNGKRALEGELARSINSLKQVKASRVHLVMPERSPFQETSVKASASVLLTLNPGAEINKKRIEGITSLIAGSVEGLEAKNVTIIDNAGNRLTDGKDGSSAVASENGWLKAEQKTEKYLTQRGQSMLDRVLGPGNSIVRVSVDQNFDSLVRKSNSVDPESRTLISEKREQQEQTGKDSKLVPIDEFTPVGDRGKTSVVSNNDNKTSSRTRNYEVSKTNEVYKKAKGEITQISASVLLNYKRVKQTNEAGEVTWKTEPYSESELEEFRQIIGSALGISAKRGDKVTIKQVQFWSPTEVAPRGMVDGPWPWTRILRWAVIFLTLGLIVWLLYGLKKQMQSNQPGLILESPFGSGQPMLAEGESGVSIENMSEEELKELINDQGTTELPEAREKNYDMEEIVNMVEIKPEKAAKIVRGMLMSSDDDK